MIGNIGPMDTSKPRTRFQTLNADTGLFETKTDAAVTPPLV